MHDVAGDLRERLGEACVLTGPDEVTGYRHDDAEWAPYATPLAVVLPETVEEVVAAVRIAARHRTPIVTRGAGTGLSGGANAVEGGIVLSLERMTRILALDAEERYVVTEAGVLTDDLRRHVAEHGLWYPPDPASHEISTIGGNIATNPGGICCVKYGVTGDYVLGLTVVTADGRVARTGRTTAKGVTGLDLTSLLVGSEGTLGIVVEATLSLRPLQGREDRVVVGSFARLTDAGEAVAAIGRAGIVPSALELIDRNCLTAVNAWQGLDLPEAEATLFARIDDPGPTGEALARQVHAILTDSGAHGLAWAHEPDEIDVLLRARRLAYPALERLGPVLTEDVCVPRRQVPTMLARIEAIAAESRVTIANIAHAGDGNLHPLIIAPEGDDAAKDRAERAFERIVHECRALGGTVTGEHGVGLLKLPGAAAELDPVALEWQHAIKDALDPLHLLNPGKAIPPRRQDTA